MAKVRKWLATPSQYRERDAPTIETIFSPGRLTPQNPSQTDTAGGKAGSPSVRGRVVHINTMRLDKSCSWTCP